jgi:mycothiol maleylpyruvate isomerase-like protein
MGRFRELLRDEDAAWKELIDLLESLTPDQVEEPGYVPEGWSVKDLMAHIGSWAAEAGQMLERIRVGTYTDDRVDVDAMNARFYEANKDLPLGVVRAEMWSARTRMLTEWAALPEITPEAEEWFVESGANHYREHIPRLGEWVEELRARGSS